MPDGIRPDRRRRQSAGERGRARRRRPRGCCAGSCRGRRGRRRRRPRPRVGSRTEAEVLEQHRHRQDRRGRVGDAAAGDVGRRAVHRLEHRRVGAADVEVAAGREPDAAGDRGGEVGEDVAEQVVGDDHVEALRLGDQEDGRGVDVQVVGGDVGELLADPGDGALPQAAGVHEHVGLVHQREVVARAGGGATERVADDPLHAVRRVDADLGGDLVRRYPRARRRRCRRRGPRCPRGHDEIDVVVDSVWSASGEVTPG